MIRPHSLHQHFKGIYCYILGIARDTNTNDETVFYSHVGSNETYSRPLSEWLDDVSDREDNVTGQSTRFVEIKDLSNPLEGVSDEQLITELSRRNTIYTELDIEGLNSKVFARDYAIAKVLNEDTDPYLTDLLTFDDQEDAERTAKSMFVKHGKPRRLFKRIYIEVKL